MDDMKIRESAEKQKMIFGVGDTVTFMQSGLKANGTLIKKIEDIDGVWVVKVIPSSMMWLANRARDLRMLHTCGNHLEWDEGWFVEEKNISKQVSKGRYTLDQILGL